MGSFVQSCAARTPYRIASVILLLAAFGLPAILNMLGGPDRIGALIGIALYILLIVITYYRLRDAALAGAWIGLMIISFNVGPGWHGWHIGSLVNLVPIVLAWTVKRGAGAHPQAARPDQLRA